MIRVLVPTDYSENSKTGILFAIQWAKQQRIELVFIHIMQILLIPRAAEGGYLLKVKEEEKKNREELSDFIHAVYKSVRVKPVHFSCIVRQGVSADISIMDYCREKKDINFICIGTRGAGKHNRLLGTHTGNLIIHSEVPVIAVPLTYTTRKFTKALYLSDLEHFAGEIDAVRAFSKPLNLKVEILHIRNEDESLPEAETYKKILSKKMRGKTKLKIEPARFVTSILYDWEVNMNMIKPSVVILFTDQSRSFFRKIFSPSKSERLSFQCNFPLLVFPKK